MTFSAVSHLISDFEVLHVRKLRILNLIINLPNDEFWKMIQIDSRALHAIFKVSE